MQSNNEKADSAPGHQHGSEVTIKVDGDDRSIAEGVYKVSTLKSTFGIPADYEFDEVTKDGEFKPLNDERSVHIRGGEVFVSHVRQGGSS